MKEFKFFRGYKKVNWWNRITNQERRVFTINFGDMSPRQIDEYITRIQGNINQPNLPIIDHISIPYRSRP